MRQFSKNNKILIEVIITNQCNKRCEYCDLDFKNTFISDKNISLFIDFINKEGAKVEYFHINFFGGEPLLGFEKIKKIVEGININNIKYSIGTNGNLFNNNILDFFYNNNIQISLSVDNITGFKNIYSIEKKYLDFIEINFINDPNFLFNSKKIFDEIIKYGFKKINFMPIFTTKNWERNNLIKLGKIVKYIKNINLNIVINYYFYFNGISNEKQFILDTNGCFFYDLDGLLWLQKQYSCLSEKLRKKIELNTKVGFLGKSITMSKLIEKYNLKDIIELVNKIPKELNQEKQNILIETILNNIILNNKLVWNEN